MYRCIDFALSQADTSLACTMDRMPATSDVAHTFFTAATRAMTLGGRMKSSSSWLYRALVSAWLLACPGAALANSDVEKLIADPRNWAMQAGDMYNQRYSKLTQINAQNVGKMQVAWMFSTGVLRGHEGSPLVIDGMMYLHTPFPNKVFAIDLDTQKSKSSCNRPIARSSHSTREPAKWFGRSRTAIPKSVRSTPMRRISSRTR